MKPESPSPLLSARLRIFGMSGYTYAQADNPNKMIPERELSLLQNPEHIQKAEMKPDYCISNSQ
jgi:hypothetical protein